MSLQPDSTLSLGRRLLLLPVLLAPVAIAAPAFAQDIAAAEALFNRGMADMEAGRYATGCAAIGESQKLDPRPGTLFTLAVCQTRWGRIATAFTLYGDYLTLYERLSPDQKARQRERPIEAKKQREELAPQIPELTLTLAPEAPPRTIVTRDGIVVADAALNLALPVDPGEHVVTTQAPGGPVSEQKVTIGKGEKKTLTLEVTPAPAAPAATPGVGDGLKLDPSADPQASKDARGPSGRRVAAYATGGVGLAGLVLGGVMGGLAMAKKGVITDHCGSAVHSTDATACDQTGLDAASSAKTMALVSSIGFGVGAAGVGAALVLILTEPATSKPATGANRRWMTAGVLDAGPAGAVLGVRGAW